jgi:hypothetical protein
MSGIVRARIDGLWAEQDWEAQTLIRDFNRVGSEDVHNVISIERFGGLIIACSEALYNRDEAELMASTRSVVNLAFGEPARITSTSDLVTAALVAGDRPGLVNQLMWRQLGSSVHGPDEPWILPAHALELID